MKIAAETLAIRKGLVNFWINCDKTANTDDEKMLIMPNIAKARHSFIKPEINVMSVMMAEIISENYITTFKINGHFCRVYLGL